MKEEAQSHQTKHLRGGDLVLPEVLRWPDPRLSQRCAAVDPADLGGGGFDRRVRFRRKVRGLVDALAAQGGLGLAAPQVGWMARVFVAADSRVLLEERRLTKVPVVVFVNPVKLDLRVGEEPGSTYQNEGCLSFPGAFAPVRRDARCRLRWLTVDGEEVEHDFGGMDARCVQHELDHLDGVVFLSRMEEGVRGEFLAKFAAVGGK